MVYWKSEWYPGDNGCVCLRLDVCLNESHQRLFELIPSAPAGLWRQSGEDMVWGSTLFSQGQSKPRYRVQEYDYTKLCICDMTHYSHPDVRNCVMHIHRFFLVLLTICAPWLLYWSFIKQSFISPVISKLSWWPSMWHFIWTFPSLNSEGCFQSYGPCRHIWEVNDWEDTSGSAWYYGRDSQSGCLPLQRLCQLGVGCGECALTLWGKSCCLFRLQLT